VGNVSYTFIADVTTAGTLLIQAQAASITGTPQLLELANGILPQATGYTAIKIA
jgi:hypothetical protein